MCGSLCGRRCRNYSHILSLTRLIIIVLTHRYNCAAFRWLDLDFLRGLEVTQAPLYGLLVNAQLVGKSSDGGQSLAALDEATLPRHRFMVGSHDEVKEHPKGVRVIVPLPIHDASEKLYPALTLFHFLMNCFVSLFASSSRQLPEGLANLSSNRRAVRHSLSDGIFIMANALL